MLGEHERAIQDIDARTLRIETAVIEIRQQLAEKRGERRVAIWLAGVAGGLIAMGLPTLGHLLLLALRGRAA